MRAITSIFMTLILFISNTNAEPNAAVNNDKADLKIYVENLIQQGYDVFHDSSLTEQDRRNKASELIQSHLYFDWMANYSLGRFRKKVEADKIKEFINTYTNFVVKAYTDLTLNYHGEKGVFKSIKKIDDNLFMVSTEIVKPDTGSSIKVDYLVHKVADAKTPYLVGDIITEGISILNSQQSEFNNILSKRGIDGLIADLENKIKKGDAKVTGSTTYPQ
ncbi:MAG: ABC transporter substrate-binding protein [Rickettsiales bacterium]|nr:MAG: ABC transporter substrate-binding protein [Rickettsiales bacterium]